MIESIDPHRWARANHNPVALLLDIADERLDALAADEAFVARVAAVHGRFLAYMNAEDTWADRSAPERRGETIAYFSMEFGLHESVKIYSGGLGVLAGDHVRSASDLGLDFVAVGLLYRQGYFKQVVEDGNQVAAYPRASFARLPLILARDATGEPITVEVPHQNHTYQARIWELRVGRVRLFLLDADFAENGLPERTFTAQLYGGDSRTRVAQEVLLGVGGVRALTALGIEPTTVHLNEGHCAFAPLEMIRVRCAAGEAFRSARTAVRRQVVFTTHTPVPAGHDRFSWDLVNEALGGWRDDMGWPHGTLMDHGRVVPGDIHEPLCMTVLALKMSRAANGVSALHGEVSRGMWRELTPTAATLDEVPIGHVTNGIHPIFWMDVDTRALYDAHLPGWREHLSDGAFWAESIDRLPDGALWKHREKLRAKLLEEVHGREGARGLAPERLTLGFARRFAPYKRANLLFTDPDRLQGLMDGERPFQIIFSGKAHPADLHGQALVTEILRMTAHRRFRSSVAFVEDYDIHVGRALTQGADVWLNNPRRPREASGTSGQKVCLSGGLNLSVLDGWWPEAYDGTNGWAIGDEEGFSTVEEQDASDAEALYRLLEEELIPDFYERDSEGVPRRWVARMKRSIVTCLPVFNTHRMVRDYARKIYWAG